MSGVQTLKVGEDEGEQRLDRWLRRRFPNLNQIKIEKMCRKGELRVDGGRVKPATRLEVGNAVRIPPLEEGEPVASGRNPNVITVDDVKLIQSCVIYKDEHLIVLNKPAGLATQGGSGQTRHVDGLSEALKFEREDKPKLVHRLDKDTSGVLLLARTGRAAAVLAKSFNLQQTRKIYWAVVAGVPAPKKGTIKFGVVKAGGHGPQGEGEKMIAVHPDMIESTSGAKKAVTDYAVIEAAAKRTAWVALAPLTGRTHQLRVHMAEIGNPIIGDGKYGGSGQTNEGDGWGAQLGGDVSRKMHLHARSISLLHPISRKQMRFVAPLPNHMQKTWDLFGWSVGDAADDPFADEE